MPLLSYAGAATSYAFSAATAYALRPSASDPRSKSHLNAQAQTDLIRLHGLRLPPLPKTNTFHPQHSDANDDPEKLVGELMCDAICEEDELYAILGLRKKAKPDEIRRAFLGRSRLCHPDKLPHYSSSTTAFQRLSFAYKTLSKPETRRLYDLGGMQRMPDGGTRSAAADDENLNGLVWGVFDEFINGDFEMIRNAINALNDGNPGLNLSEDHAESIIGTFAKVRDILLSGQKYMRIVRFEILRLFEIQHALRQLGYFNVTGRLRLALTLARVALEVPMVVDRAMIEDAGNQYGGPHASRDASAANSEDSQEEAAAAADGAEGRSKAKPRELQSRGFLPVRVKGALVLTCKMLEKGERLGL